MAIRISRRAKYLVVLAFITLLLYGSIGTPQLNVLQLKSPSTPQSSKSFDKNPEDDTFRRPFQTPNEQEDERTDPEESDEVAHHPSIAKPDKLPESESVESVPVPAKIPFDTSAKPQSKSAASETSDLAAELAALDEDDTVSPTENLLPDADPKENAREQKFPLGRKENHPVDPKDLIHLPSDPAVRIAKIQTEDPSLSETKAQKQVRLERQMQVRDVFKRDWAAYKRYAWMHDELKPVSNSSNDPFGGWGATLVDALDTMLIMDLQEEYDEASEAVAKIDFTYTAASAIPVFETTIRYLGGLLAAYDLGVAKGKKDSGLLSQAKTLGQVLYGAFDTPNRMPMLKYNYRKQAGATSTLRSEKSGVMAEVGSLSVEFTRLAQLSDGDDRHKFFDAIQRITDALEESMDEMDLPGLWPLKLDLSGCKPEPRPTKVIKPTKPTSPADPASSTETHAGLEKAEKATNDLFEVLATQKTAALKTGSNVVERRQVDTAASGGAQTTGDKSVTKERCVPQGIRKAVASSQTYSQGGQADSTYEYFTKEYLLLGGVPAAEQYKRLYEKSIDATKDWLVFRPLVPGDLGAKDILMAGDVETKAGKTPELRAKMQHLTCFIGGMVAMGAKVFSRPDDLALAAKLTDGCVWAYDYSPSGVAPEVFHVHECKDKACNWQDFLDENDRAEAALSKQSLVTAPDWAAEDSLERMAKAGTPPPPAGAAAAAAVPGSSGPVAKRDPAVATESENLAASLADTAFANTQNAKSRPFVDPVSRPPTDEFKRAMFWTDPRYILRPEAIESVWYMYRITGDPTWQEKGWRMWLATERLTRTPVAHTAVTNIMDPPALERMDSLESFWFAETLKYYFLLFSDFGTVSLDEYVLNTEAHPLKRSL